MAYQRRKGSESSVYHVIVRGAGRQIIFEDDDDRMMYLAGAEALIQELPLALYAWCLMDNHVHLLVHTDLDVLARFMRDLGRFYARHFNDKHDRVGHLTQGRYKSVPIESEGQFLNVLRYIHQNPCASGLSQSCAWRWSSYLDYCGRTAYRHLIDPKPALGLFKDIASFKRYHEQTNAGEPVPIRSRSPFRLNDAEAQSIYRELLGEEGLTSIPLQDRAARNRLLASLRLKGLSIRQICRLTGIGRGVVARVA